MRDSGCDGGGGGSLRIGSSSVAIGAAGATAAWCALDDVLRRIPTGVGSESKLATRGALSGSSHSTRLTFNVGFFGGSEARGLGLDGVLRSPPFRSFGIEWSRA